MDKGKFAYEHCKKYVKEIILVSDEEIIQTCRVLFERGLKVEPSGCAALAALIHGKIKLKIDSTADRKVKVVVIVSGGNISAKELADLI